MAIVNVGNGKGGVNKTTIALQLGLLCVEKGQKVLFIDLDGQEDLSRLLGKQEDFKGMTSAGLFLKEHDLGDIKTLPVTQWQCRNKAVSELMHYIPAHHSSLANINQSAEVEYLSTFKANVQKLHTLYDVIIIDTPPSLGTCQYASLCVATTSILPCIPDFDTCGSEKIEQYFRIYKAAIKNSNPKLGFPIVVLTSVEAKGAVVQEYISWAKETFGKHMIPIYIEHSRAAVLNANRARRAVWFGTVSGNDREKGASIRRVIEKISERLV
jgi:chromosome partitioning protein